MRCTLVTICMLLITSVLSVHAGTIENSKHDLSVNSNANIRATSEQEICVFCHTPHNSSPQAPLWNRTSSGQNYQPYNSSSALASIGQPTGASLLCLSCHDGTIALGDVLSKVGNIQMNTTNIPQGNTRIGTDLTDDHPVSFNFTNTLANARGELVNPSGLTGAVKLDSNGQMQCTSCHDPHDNDNGKFLVMQNVESSLCKTCHQKDFWNQTAHATSNKVKAAACGNCHLPHNAGANERLLASNNEEANCLNCHDGSVANHNIQNEFTKFSRHPIFDFSSTTAGGHRPNENVQPSSRHVECVDCHNPHAANSGNPLNGVRGVNQSGNEVNTINETQHLCYRCHAESASPGSVPNGASRTTRQFNRVNTRVEFDTSNASYHPVAGQGRNSFVPSLMGGLTSNSRIDCIDCHNNNNTNGANGPHGSVYEPILERNYQTADPTTESAGAYAMCYKCHDRASILNNESFPRHSFHINGGGGMGGMGGMSNLQTPCNVCHDPHGSQQPKLINFDRNVVSPSNSGRLEHYSNATGAGSGGCYLNCHGRNHDPCTYDSQAGTAGGCMMGGGGGGGGGGGHGGM